METGMQYLVKKSTVCGLQSANVRHRKHNGYQSGHQSDKLIFYVRIRTSTPKLKTVWYARKVVV